MGAKDKLIIHKLKFDLEVGDKQAFDHYSKRISALCRRLLPERLDAILKRYDLPQGKLIINKMIINAGIISPLRFEQIVVKKIAFEFEDFLKRNISSLSKEIKQSKFKKQLTNKIVVKNSDFIFESEFSVPQSIMINEEKETSVRKVRAVSLIEALKKDILIDEPYSQVPEYFSNEILDTRKSISAKQKKNINEEIDANLDHKPPDKSLPPALKLEESDEFISSPLSKGESAMDSQEKKMNVRFLPTESRAEQVYSKEEVKTINLLRQLPELKPKEQLKLIQALEVIPTDLPPKQMTPLEKAFIYYIVYGRLPSNVKYELGMRMSEIFNINQTDVRFFNDIKNRIRNNLKAKQRLIRLSDSANKASLIKKDIISVKDTEDFDMKTPPAFADYFIALALDLDTTAFTPLIQRYNLNDMVRFFYADHPQKLRNLIEFLLLKYPTDKSLRENLESLLQKIGKGSIVKIFASFARKAGDLNKILNQLNKSNGKDLKAAHTSVLFALLKGIDPSNQLRKDGFDLKKDLPIENRNFKQSLANLTLKEYSKVDLIDYYLRYGALPYSSSNVTFTSQRIDVLIQSLSSSEISQLKYFRNELYKLGTNYEVAGQLSNKAIYHLLKTLKPGDFADLSTKYEYFKYNLKSGVPVNFQNAFLLYYAFNKPPVSYLEGMLEYWKSQFGDDDKIIKRRWKVSDELSKEFNQLLFIKEEPLENIIKVDYEFQSYSQDISVKNAGLVILWPFLKIYFKMLDLLNEEGDFRSIKERARACHLLQYLAIKQSYGEELYYPLNKILTGYPLDEPLSYEITMTQKEIDVSKALLKNVLKQWNALKGSSVDGLRGSFLIRDGVIVPTPNGWLLTVEKKAYDILMNKLPWGIGMIKLSWAPYILNVEWERNIM